MLLRPRKTIFKNSTKKRSIETFNVSTKSHKLIYGQFGLKNQNPNFLLFNKYLFKIKLFLKKSVRRSNITNRLLWVKIFPHVPITKKVIGSRMGKGKGKPSL
jgi:large subunit ribosomal protein L16